MIECALVVNGTRRTVAVAAEETLLTTLRGGLQLTGAKPGCERGECGACTVLVDGRPTLACLKLTASLDGSAVTTVEGLSGPDGALHPLQEAFAAHDAFQCGYCTPGQLMAASACIAAGHAGSDDAIREWMSGNLCRCAAYPAIVAAVRDAGSRA